MLLPAKPKTGRRRVPLRLRLKAWWDGCDLVVHEVDEPAAAAAIETPARTTIGYRDPDRPWETPRVKLAQMLWGEGFSHPGGVDEAVRLVKPFALDPAMTVLDLSAGLGGGARALVEQFGVWVTGLDQDGEFAEAGMQISTLGGVAKKAEIAKYRPDRLELRANSVDCITCRELFHTVADKRQMLHTVGEGLKTRGQLLFTDYMLAAGGDPQSSAIRAWLAVEPTPVELWSLDEFARCLTEEKFEVRVTEDVTGTFRGMAIGAWAGLTGRIAGMSLAPELKACMVAELERWMRRIAAFDSGDLRLYRVYALKSAGSGMLSDW